MKYRSPGLSKNTNTLKNIAMAPIMWTKQQRNYTMGIEYQDIKRDTEASRSGVMPRVNNKIPMRIPAEEDLTRMPIEATLC
jgi:hypothetical protein